MTRATYDALLKALLDIHEAVDDAITAMKDNKAKKAEEASESHQKLAA